MAKKKEELQKEDPHPEAAPDEIVYVHDTPVKRFGSKHLVAIGGKDHDVTAPEGHVDVLAWLHDKIAGLRANLIGDAFVPEVEIQSEVESESVPGYWNQKFTLIDPADRQNPYPVDRSGAKLDLSDPAVLAEQWRLIRREQSGGGDNGSGSDGGDGGGE